MTEVAQAGLPVIALYTIASVLTFMLYGTDKRAARRNTPRIPESTLHLLALFGGWPGALAAQHVFHHKSRKQPFRTVFWVTVVANSLALAGLLATSAS